MGVKICLNCGNEFQIKVKIDGKYRNLQRRKYCLDCSPYKAGNTKKLHELPEELKYIICDKPLTGNQTNFCSGTCKVAHHNNPDAQKERSVVRKAYLVMLAGGGCNRCGFDDNLAALHFHHINPAKKKFKLDARNLSNKYWDHIVAEFEKCELLCANCHAKEHFPEYDDWHAKYDPNYADKYDSV